MPRLPARPRLLGSALMAALAFAIMPTESLNSRFLVAWDIGVACYLVLAWIMAARSSTNVMQEHAAREHDGAVAVLILTLTAAVASLAAIVVELQSIHNDPASLGAIAAHGGPGALALFRKVLLASASIPGLFPPVMIDVVGHGRLFQEMHVDGGASAYLFVAPEPMLLDDHFDERLPTERLYVILNNTLRSDFAMTERATSAVLGRAMSVGTRALTALEIAALVQLCRRQSIDFNLTSWTKVSPSQARALSIRPIWRRSSRTVMSRLRRGRHSARLPRPSPNG